MLKWLRIFAAVALFLSGVWLGYSVRKTPSKPLQSIVAASSQIVNNPASIVTAPIAAAASYPFKYRGPTKYRLGVMTNLPDLSVDQVTLSYRAYQRLWLDAGFDVKRREVLLGVSYEF